MGSSIETIREADNFFDMAHLRIMSRVNESIKSQHDQVNHTARGLLACDNGKRNMFNIGHNLLK